MSCSNSKQVFTHTHHFIHPIVFNTGNAKLTLEKENKEHSSLSDEAASLDAGIRSAKTAAEEAEKAAKEKRESNAALKLRLAAVEKELKEFVASSVRKRENGHAKNHPTDRLCRFFRICQ